MNDQERTIMNRVYGALDRQARTRLRATLEQEATAAVMAGRSSDFFDSRIGLLDAIAHAKSEDHLPSPSPWIHDPEYHTWTLHGRDCWIWIDARPAYCDRGRWLAHLELRAVSRGQRPLVHIDAADGWPRYYFDLACAKTECEAWMKNRGQWEHVVTLHGSGATYNFDLDLVATMKEGTHGPEGPSTAADRGPGNRRTDPPGHAPADRTGGDSPGDSVSRRSTRPRQQKKE